MSNPYKLEFELVQHTPIIPASSMIIMVRHSEHRKVKPKPQKFLIEIQIHTNDQNWLIQENMAFDDKLKIIDQEPGLQTPVRVNIMPSNIDYAVFSKRFNFVLRRLRLI
ncbi:MAG: hypothetical protein U5Q03_17455 [Bacteroidota bacterium]|nr:hypothetical protein [Bacteroidota bacterium]